MPTATRHLQTPAERRPLLDGPLGAFLLLGAGATGGGCSLVEHPLAPRALGAPVHTHRREDEYSYVLEGRIGFEIGGETFEASAGDLVFKPCGVQHAFWNPTGEPARILELIVPGGFEGYFAELGAVFAAPGAPDLEALQEIATRYGLDVDPTSIPRLAAEHGLDLGCRI
jgi:mannose-6-phosphate isomerase-like protein (cupin superfamily)